MERIYVQFLSLSSMASEYQELHQLSLDSPLRLGARRFSNLEPIANNNSMGTVHGLYKNFRTCQLQLRQGRGLRLEKACLNSGVMKSY